MSYQLTCHNGTRLCADVHNEPTEAHGIPSQGRTYGDEPLVWIKTTGDATLSLALFMQLEAARELHEQLGRAIGEAEA